MTYKHKELATHPSEDECSHHRNEIKLPRHVKDLAEVCVRVNGKPVRHIPVDGTDDAVVIGPVAGPHDTITAHFCIGTAKCAEACDYPKKEVTMRDSFIDAIGGASDDAANENGDEQGGAWQETDAKKGAEVAKALDPDMRKELENTDTTVRKPASKATTANANLEIFKEWLNEGEKSSCVKAKHAAGMVQASK